MEYQNVISTWHHRCVVASGDLQNLNILIFKIAIQEFYIWGNIFTILHGAKALFSHDTKSPTERNWQSRSPQHPTILSLTKRHFCPIPKHNIRTSRGTLTFENHIYLFLPTVSSVYYMDMKTFSSLKNINPFCNESHLCPLATRCIFVKKKQKQKQNNKIK